jgi:hypothetical protein
MKKQIIIILLLMIFIINIQSNDLKSISGFSSPESAISDGKYIYVSNVGEKLEPITKDKDGYISKLDIDGNVIDKFFVPKGKDLNAPKGMGIIGNILYVVDIDRVVGFNKKSGNKVFDLTINGSFFLNDITVYDNKGIYVSDTATSKIYKVNIKTGQYEELNIDYNFYGLNGLYYDKRSKKLYLVSMGAETNPESVAGYIDKNNNFTKLEGVSGLFDGVSLLNNNILLISDWVAFEKKGIIIKYDLKKNKKEELLIDKIAGPADFYYDNKNNIIIIPEMMLGNIIIKKMD